MTNPKRYDIEYYDGQNVIAPDENGDYVRWEDYEVLRGNLSAGRENAQLINDNGAQEIERLRACWAEALANVTQRNQEIELHKRYLAWQSKEIDAQVTEITRLQKSVDTLNAANRFLSEQLESERRAAEPSERRPVVNAIGRACKKCDSTSHVTLDCPFIDEQPIVTASGAPRGEVRREFANLIHPMEPPEKSAEPYCTCPDDYPNHAGHHADCNALRTNIQHLEKNDGS
jgi:hypothetical protein